MLGLSNRRQQTSDAACPVWGITFCIGNFAWRVIGLVKFNVRTCMYREVLIVQYASAEPLLICSTDVPTFYVFPMEKHDLYLVTSTCTMSCNVLLLDCTRHKKPVLGYFESSPKVSRPAIRQLQKASIRAPRCIHCKSTAPHAK
jgi:hypothetical protein